LDENEKKPIGIRRSRLGQAFEESRRVKESDLVSKAIKNMLSKSSSDNGDDSVIRKWNREMKKMSTAAEIDNNDKVIYRAFHLGGKTSL
jgi:hypothetical protein